MCEKYHSFKMSPSSIFTFFLCFTFIFGMSIPIETYNKDKSQDKLTVQPITEFRFNVHNNQNNIVQNVNAKQSVSSTPVILNSSKSRDVIILDRKILNKVNDMESGAVLRGILVFVGISVLFIMYLAFRNYSNKRNKMPIIVRKYGVRTRRNDVEMTPLPLDEDEDDETVFDVGNVNR